MNDSHMVTNAVEYSVSLLMVSNQKPKIGELVTNTNRDGPISGSTYMVGTKTGNKLQTSKVMENPCTRIIYNRDMP